MVAKTAGTSSKSRGRDWARLRASIAVMQSENDNMPENIVLIGPMGSGKTTIGKRLAAMLDKQFIDCDVTLEEQLGVNISLVFELEGEEGFRRREHLMLKELCRGHNIVLATGGGCVLQPGNRELLREFGTVVYLQTPVEYQLRRLERDKSRPLLQRPDREEHLHKLADERNPIYAELADITIQAQDLPVDHMARETLEQLRLHFKHSPCPV